MHKIIKQKVFFRASPKEVFETLMDSKKHGRFTGKKALISRVVGGKISAYGGYIEGYNLTLVKNKTIVQAWRGADWPKGHWSIASFELAKYGASTKLNFTHVNVPDKHIKDITEGWKSAYWEKMQKMFSLHTPRAKK